jgi:hypothetical protein
MALVGTPYSIISQNCSKVEPLKSCYIDFKMTYNDTFDYSTPVSFNIFPFNPIKTVNPNFGNIILSGQKQAPDLTINHSAFIVSPSVDFIVASYNFPSVTKRYFLKNISSKNIIAPSIVLSSDLSLIKNTCENVSLNQNQICFFEVLVSYSSDPLKAYFQDSITFTSNDPLVDTSSLSILLNISNINNFQPTLVNFYQQSINVINPSKISRLYIKNNSQKSISGLPSIAAPYELVKTNCSYLTPDSTCYVDFKVGPILNVKGISMPISFSGIDYYVKVGQPLSDNSVTCDSGYDYYNNCVILSRSQSCSVTNGTGLQQSNDAGVSWGQCMVSYCNSGYTIVNNSCALLNQSRTCSFTTPAVRQYTVKYSNIQNYSSQTSNDGGVTWGVCHGVSCPGTTYIKWYWCYQY